MTDAWPFLAVSLLILGSAGSVAAGDLAAGRSVAETVCATCHGVDGIAVAPDAPHLAGENRLYLRAQLRAFRSGRRQHPQMSIIAQALTDQELADVVAWYEAIQITAVMPD